MKQIITSRSAIDDVLNSESVYLDMSDAVEDTVVAEIDSEN